MLGPFERLPGVILGPDPSVTFDCPVARERVAWAAKDVFNPGAVVHDGRVHLLVRAEDAVGPIAGTSRIGLASEDDGVTFTLEPEPVLFPDDDEWQSLEWPGGCEDPRVVESPDGGFVCTYTAFDWADRPILMRGDVGRPAHVGEARSRVRGHGPRGTVGRRADRSSPRCVDGRLGGQPPAGPLLDVLGRGDVLRGHVDGPAPLGARRVRRHRRPLRCRSTDGRWGIDSGAAATTALRPLLLARPGASTRPLVEPGPPAVHTDDGILLIYNGANHPSTATRRCRRSPTSRARRCSTPRTPPPASPARRRAVPPPRAPRRALGQVDNVCFAEGLVRFHEALDPLLRHGRLPRGHRRA